MSEQLKTPDVKRGKEYLVNGLGSGVVGILDRSRTSDDLIFGDYERLHNNVHRSQSSEQFYFKNGESITLGHELVKNNSEYDEFVTLHTQYVIDRNVPDSNDIVESKITISISPDGIYQLTSIQKKFLDSRDRQPIEEYVAVTDEEEQAKLLNDNYGKIFAIQEHLSNDISEYEDSIVPISRFRKIGGWVVSKTKSFFIEEASSFKGDHSQR